jgi:signal transduction histidine kinase
MKQRLRRILSPANGRLALVAILALATLGLIAWAGMEAWGRPCQATTGLSLIGTSDCPSLIVEMDPLLVALGFWAIGLLVVRYAEQPSLPNNFFFLIAGALAAGKESAMGNYTGGQLFYLQLIWLIPLTFHFHHSLLARPLGRIGRFVLAGLYGLAAVFSLPLLVWSIRGLEEHGWFLPLRIGVRLSFALSIGLAVLLLFRDYRVRASPATRRRVRLVTFGTLFAFAPFVLLSLVPDTLGAAHLRYELTFPWLLLSPSSYAYSLFRDRFKQADAPLRRVAVYYLLITLLLAIYLAVAAVLNRLVANPADQWPLIGALLGVGLLLLFAPLKEMVARLANWVWYGSEISYARVVGQLAEALALALDRETLRSLLVDDVTRLMRLSRSALLLKEGDGRLALAGMTGFDASDLAALHLPAGGGLATYLKAEAEPVNDAQVHQALAAVPLDPDEQALLSLDGLASWLPLVSGESLQGLLLLGPRPGGDSLSSEEEHILATLAYQGGIAAHNVWLIEQVRAGREELARAHRQLLVAREREQRRLAHELHDGAVQQLLGISYQLVQAQHVAADGNGPALETSRQGILGVVRGLRSLIGELRPAGLEELGLGAALEGYVARLVREGGAEAPAIYLHLDGSRGAGLPEPVAICLFRAAQEALRNALKHAGARRIVVSLQVHTGEATLVIHDDGCGFQVPERLSELARSDRFGLVGIAERVAWAGGRLDIQSQPGQGTELKIWIPYDVKRQTSNVKRKA